MSKQRRISRSSPRRHSNSNSRYNHSSSAIDYHQAYPDGYKKTKRKKVLRRIKKATIIRRVSNDKPTISKYTIITILIVFTGVMSIALNYSRISTDRAEIRALTSQLQRLQEDNNSLEFQISESYDLREIERIATTRLGMHRPRSHQVVFISVPVETFVVRRNNPLAYERMEEDSPFQKVLDFFLKQRR